VAKVEIADPAACPRYLARVIEGVTIGPSPAWVGRRLRALGLRPISNVVDATNYVLMELGHPLHAFDLDRLAGHKIVVRLARPGERMRTLDDIERLLSPEDIVIADAERPVALAGVMGGGDSEVTSASRRLLLESAVFDPGHIRRTAKRVGLHTEASHRFERGADADTAALASARCAALLAEWAGGHVVGGAIDVYPRPVAPRTVVLRTARAQRLLGVELAREDMARLLGSIELDARPADDGLAVRVPSFRPDLVREVDLIEEVARLYGYDRVPEQVLRASAAPGPSGEPIAEATRDALSGLGLDEVTSFGFVAQPKIAALGLPADDPRTRPVRVKNPLREDTEAMRTSLLPGLLGVLRGNLDRGVGRVSIFELGTVFFMRGEGELPDERPMAGVLLAGERAEWLAPARGCDFFDLKGIGERLLERLGWQDARFVQAPGLAPFHPGVAAQVGDLGVAGEVHPAVRARFGIAVPCFYLELDLSRRAAADPVRVSALPRHPAIARDVSFYIDAHVPASEVARCLQEVEEPLLVEIDVREDYRDPARVPTGKKSMLWSLLYRAADRTLTDQEVSRAHERITAALRDRLQVQLR
jgi:phenylalanyl-tRNA synthetase beta chain